MSQRAHTRDQMDSAGYDLSFEHPRTPGRTHHAVLRDVDVHHRTDNDHGHDHGHDSYVLTLTFRVNGAVGSWLVELDYHQDPVAHFTLHDDLPVGASRPSTPRSTTTILHDLEDHVIADLAHPQRRRQLAAAIDAMAHTAAVDPAFTSREHLVLNFFHAARLAACAAYATTPVVTRAVTEADNSGYDGPMLTLVEAIVSATGTGGTA